MPILRIGRTKKREQAIRQSGFTLVEILVTLLILGLMTGIVAFNLPKAKDPRSVYAHSLCSQIKQLAELALVSQAPHGIRINEEELQFVQFNAEQWRVIGAAGFPVGEWELRLAGRAVDLDAAKQLDVPLIRYDITGLATPFTLRLGDNFSSLSLIGEMDGSVSIQTSGDDES